MKESERIAELTREYERCGYAYTRAKHYAKQRYMREVLSDLKKNHPEKYAQLQVRVQQEAEQREREERERKAREAEAARVRAEQERLRQLAIARVNKAVAVPGIPLPQGPLPTGIIAFRQWKMCNDGWLHGIAYGSGYAWKEINRADRVPTERNDHGLYSVRPDPESLVSGKVWNFLQGANVCGLVNLRGQVVEHTDGWCRAEFARIMCIWVTAEALDTYELMPYLIRNYFNVPVFVCSIAEACKALVAVMLVQGYADQPEQQVEESEFVESFSMQGQF